MTKEEIKKLFKHNVAELTNMDRDAGSMVKQLLWELQAGESKIYIRLRDAEEDGSVVYYDVIEGDPRMVELYAQTLGFTAWDSERLEV